MFESPAALVIDCYLFTNRRLLSYLQRLSDEQLRWQLNPQTLSIAWHGWHLARWADFTQAAVPGMTPELARRLPPGAQLWEAEKIAERWGFDNSLLGWGATGMEMADSVATSLKFPAKDELLAYVERSFTLTAEALSAIDETQFNSPEQLQPMTEGIWGESTVGDAVMVHITHSCRHLGMMECLLGLQGVPGTATT
jgi:hypothetical protein